MIAIDNHYKAFKKGGENDLAKINDSAFGRVVKVRLMEKNMTQEQLCKAVQERTGKYFDSSYLWKVCNGVLKTPDIVSAICEIMELDNHE